MQYPEKPFEHRDAVLGISFPMDTIDNYPMVCGEPPAALKKLLPLLKKLHGTLQVDKLSAGEHRAITAACDGARDNGSGYDTEAGKEEQLRGWRVMWFVSEYAFGDAYSLSGYWKLKAPSLWKDAKGYIDRITTTMCRYHPAEEEEACKIWCCFASPYRNPDLVKTWEQK